MRVKSKYLVFIVCLFCLIGVAIFSSKKSKPLQGTDFYAVEQDQKAQSLWKRLSFTSVANTNLLCRYLLNIPFEGEELISKEQKEKLSYSLSLLTTAYYDGSYQSYMSFRIPQGVEYEYATLPMEAAAKAWMKKHLQNEKLPDNPELLHWRLTHVLGNDRVCNKKSWKGICIDPNEIYGCLGKTNIFDSIDEVTSPRAGIYISKESVVGEYFFHTPETFNTDGTTQYYSSLHFKYPDDQKVFLTAKSYFFIKLSNDMILPFYIVHIYHTGINQWVPVAMGSGLNERWRSKVNYISF